LNHFNLLEGVAKFPKFMYPVLMSVESRIKQKAIDIGFDVVGITSVAPLQPASMESFVHWLDDGCAADMYYLQKNIDKRFSPERLLSNAKSIICFGLNYKPPELKTNPKNRNCGKIVSYALYEDYHQFIKNKLRWFVIFLSEFVGRTFDFKICVDSVPIAERELAQRAGLGFVGKNHMLINPKLGPQLFLAEIITNLDLKPDPPFAAIIGEKNEYFPSITCSHCNQCIEACPTGALKKDGTFDARLCISYLTIEHKYQIPAHLKPKIENKLFGCEQCLLVCPYQRAAPVCKNSDIRFFPERGQIDLKDVLELDKQQFDEHFVNSPIHRLGFERLKRNAAICMKNITGNVD